MSILPAERERQIYVLDWSALASIADHLTDPPAGRDLLTDLVRDGRLVYCDAVCAHLQIVCRNEPIAIWAKGCLTQVTHKAASWTKQAQIARLCPELMDQDAEESPELCAIAQAHEISEQLGDACLVTNDFGRKPFRISVEDAAIRLDLKSMRVGDFAQGVGL